MSSTYKHAPIQNSRNIRVLVVAPAPVTSAEMYCELREICLDDESFCEYSALSYCWEGQVPDQPVICSGHSLLVTKNCHIAIQKLRNQHESVTLWIDSICIDQKNVEEKSVQVALMGEIYKQAHRVVVWLGEWDSAIQNAIDIIKDIGSMHDATKSPSETERELSRKADMLKESVRSSSEDRLGALFRRPWFGRMWTVQEVALAYIEKCFLFNSSDISDWLPWTTMTLAVDKLIARKYNWTNLSRTIEVQKKLSLQVTMARYPELKAIYDAKPGDIQRETQVWPILLGCREKEATDPKDKIFALYGIFRELGIANHLPPPDYTKTVEDIYREATIACIDSDKHLYVLYEVPSDDRHLRPNLISWVPDWSDPGWRDNVKVEPRIALTRDRFCAAGSAEPKYSFSTSGHELHLRGKIVESIIYVAQPLFFDQEVTPINTGGSGDSAGHDARVQDILQHTFDVLASWVEVCKWYENYPSTGESAAQAFCRLLTVDSPTVYNKGGTPEAHQASFNSWFAMMSAPDPGLEMIRILLQRTMGSRYGPPSGPLGSSFSENEWLEAMRQKLPPHIAKTAAILAKPHGSFHTLAMSFSNKKGFYVTENGLFGTAPARRNDDSGINLAQAGDCVAIIAGLEMPMILRPVESTDGMYTLVTHTCLHGVMYGEAWEDEARLIQDIVLV